MSADCTWVVEWLDGRTEEVFGQADVVDGVLTIACYALYVPETFVQYPIATLRKWTRKP